MELEVITNEKVYTFEATPFIDEEEERLYFLVKLASGNHMLAEKLNRYEWTHVSDEEFPAHLQDVIYHAIDNANVGQLMKEPYPFDQLHQYYYSSLFNWD